MQKDLPNQEIAIEEEVTSNQENEEVQEETSNNNVSVINVWRIYGNIMNI